VSELVIQDLKASVADREILHGVNLTIRSGEVHAVMGPNGSGKSTLSHILMGKPGYTDVSGSVTLDGQQLLGLPTYRRAVAGLFLAMQYPIEVPGVSVRDTLWEAVVARSADPAEVLSRARVEAGRIGFEERFLDRPMNVDLSGGEKKRNETMMLGVLEPKFAVLDEIDSGLDVDALRAVSRRVEDATRESGLGVLAITHYSRLLNELKADAVHVLVKGRIVESGGPELVDQLEVEGYARYGVSDDDSQVPLARYQRPDIVDPWGGNPAGNN
jgi:Fe-S cluster assembly ATP-binding protein